jgi:cytidylate kinase
VEVVEGLKNITLEFVFSNDTGICEMWLNDENVEWLIRDMVVAENVSDVAAVKEVREFAVAQQRKMGDAKGIVMDGRDIGTTVFPNAELKIFLTADSSVRVDRRFKELQAKNPHITRDEVKNNLETRDYIDSNREFSPLRKADDAIVINNSNLTTGEQLKIALSLVKKKTEIQQEA